MQLEWSIVHSDNLFYNYFNTSKQWSLWSVHILIFKYFSYLRSLIQYQKHNSGFWLPVVFYLNTVSSLLSSVISPWKLNIHIHILASCCFFFKTCAVELQNHKISSSLFVSISKGLSMLYSFSFLGWGSWLQQMDFAVQLSCFILTVLFSACL